MKLILVTLALISFALIVFFALNGLTAGIIWLIATYGFIPLFPQFEQYMLSFWQIFWGVALLRAIKSIFVSVKTEEDKPPKLMPWER